MNQTTPALPGEIFEAKGQAWHLSHLSPGITASFSAWCQSQARARVAAQRPYLSPDDYREERAILQREIATGTYDWHGVLDARGIGNGASALLQTDGGQLELAALLLEERHGRLDRATVKGLIASAPDAYDLAARAALDLPPRAPAKVTAPPAAAEVPALVD